MDVTSEKILISAKELKEILGCNNNTLYELLARPDFPSFRIKSRHYILYEDFVEWARKQVKQKSSQPIAFAATKGRKFKKYP